MNKVYVFGCFDLIHPGHLNILRKSKELGDYLIVGVLGDKAITRKKGQDRPIQDYATRVQMVEALSIADKIVSQPEFDPTPQLKVYKPDILVHGDDWKYVLGQEWIDKNGGRVVKIPYTQGHSTTSIIDKIRNSK